jgi:hypothetical protein
MNRRNLTVPAAGYHFLVLMGYQPYTGTYNSDAGSPPGSWNLPDW